MRSYGLSLAYPRASSHLRHAVGELVWVVLGPLVHALHSASVSNEFAAGDNPVAAPPHPLHGPALGNGYEA